MMSVAELPGVLESLQDCNKQLDVVEKGLNDFLDTKKMAFPRCEVVPAPCGVPELRPYLCWRSQQENQQTAGPFCLPTHLTTCNELLPYDCL
jgi:hypothetical protein